MSVLLAWTIAPFARESFADLSALKPLAARTCCLLRQRNATLTLLARTATWAFLGLAPMLASCALRTDTDELPEKTGDDEMYTVCSLSAIQLRELPLREIITEGTKTENYVTRKIRRLDVASGTVFKIALGFPAEQYQDARIKQAVGFVMELESVEGSQQIAARMNLEAFLDREPPYDSAPFVRVPYRSRLRQAFMDQALRGQVVEVGMIAIAVFGPGAKDLRHRFNTVHASAWSDVLPRSPTREEINAMTDGSPSDILKLMVYYHANLPREPLCLPVPQASCLEEENLRSVVRERLELELKQVRTSPAQIDEGVSGDDGRENGAFPPRPWWRLW